MTSFPGEVTSKRSSNIAILMLFLSMYDLCAIEFTINSRMAYTGISYVSFLSRDSNEAFKRMFLNTNLYAKSICS